jgi:small-conductance mechanosensitive channel
MIQNILHFATSGAFLLVIVFLALIGRAHPILRKRYKILFLVLAVQIGRDVAGYLQVPMSSGASKALDSVFIILLVSFFVLLLRDLSMAWVESRGIRISKLIWDVVAVLIYSILILLIMKEIFGINITPLLTTSAILTAVIGLAVQDTLSNLIAGIVFHFEDSLSLGDWVEVDGVIGEVKDLSWRAVRVVTTGKVFQVIPNSDFTRKKFSNLTRVGAAREIFIGVSYDNDPDQVIDVLRRALLSTPDVRWSPEPQVIIWDFQDFAIQYRLRFFIEDYSHFHRTEGEVRRNVWYFFQEHGIKIPYPIRTLYMETKPAGATVAPQIGKILETLRNIEMFKYFSDAELADIASYAGIYEHPRGTVIAVEGEAGDSMFVILKGKVDVRKNGKTLATLGQHDIVGEIALFTGEPRGASVVAASRIEVLSVRKEGFNRILKTNEGFIAKIEVMINDRLNKTLAADEVDKTKSRQGILSQIRRYLLGG